MACNHPAYELYELLSMDERPPETTTTGFSLPLVLRLNIYNFVLDDEYEICETGLPALLRTRLQITREFYQLCKLRIVLVHERRFGFFSHRVQNRLPRPLRNYKAGDIKRYRVWQHWERILKFGKSIPRRDLFVDVKVEQWCTHAAVYPEKAIRSHGRCRSCRIRGRLKKHLIQMACVGVPILTVFAFVLCSFLLLLLKSMEDRREGSWKYPVVQGVENMIQPRSW